MAAVLLRVLLLAILIFLFVRFVVRLGRLAAAALREGSPPAAAPPPAAVPLVACGRCGVFVPRAAVAVSRGDGFLCRACAGAGG